MRFMEIGSGWRVVWRCLLLASLRNLEPHTREPNLIIRLWRVKTLPAQVVVNPYLAATDMLKDRRFGFTLANERQLDCFPRTPNERFLRHGRPIGRDWRGLGERLPDV